MYSAALIQPPEVLFGFIATWPERAKSPARLGSIIRPLKVSDKAHAAVKAGGGPGQDQGQKGQPVGPDRPPAQRGRPSTRSRTGLQPSTDDQANSSTAPATKPGPSGPRGGGKGFACQVGGRGRGEHPPGFQVYQAGGEHGQGGHGADQEGGDEHLKNAPHPLPGGLPWWRAGAAGNGRGTQPRLAGKAAQ